MTIRHIEKLSRLGRLSNVINKLSHTSVEYRLILESTRPSEDEYDEDIIVLESKLAWGKQKNNFLIKKRTILGVDNTLALFNSCKDFDPFNPDEHMMFSQQELDLVLDTVGYIKKDEEYKQPTQSNTGELQFMIEPHFTEEEQAHINKRLE